jgi:hypothetical protein
MSNERLHDAALEILKKQGITEAAATAEQYSAAAEQAQAEGVPYDLPETQETLADLDRRLARESEQALVEFELSRMEGSPTLETATSEQLHDAISKADATIKEAKQT